MRTTQALLPVLMAAAFSAPAGAAEIYHWVDESGVPHYSQWAPPEDEPSVSTMNVQGGATSGLGGDVYPVDEIARQTAQLREQREEARAERRERARDTQSSPVVIYQQPVANAAFPLGFPGRRFPDRAKGFDDDDEFPPGKGPGRGSGRGNGDGRDDDRGPRNPPSLPFRPPGDSD